MTRHEVQILRAVGMAQVAVASKSGVSVQSVRRIEREAPMTTSGEKSLVRQRRGGRPSIATPGAAPIESRLTGDPGRPRGGALGGLPGGRGSRRGKAGGYRMGRRAPRV